MIFTIDTQNLDNVNEFAEILRDYIFVGEGIGGYANFVTRPEFKILEKGSPLFNSLLNIMSNGDVDYALYVADKMTAVSNDDIHAAWWWDGDGTLLIVEGEKRAINEDCKKRKYWNWV